MHTLTSAYSWLRKFWLERLNQEFEILGLKTVKEFTRDPYSVKEGEQVLVSTSGVEVTGNFTKILRGNNNEPIYYNKTGPTQLTYFQQPIQGQGKKQHPHGFGSPVGNIKGVSKPLEDHTKAELFDLNIVEGSNVKLEFESGVKVEGDLIQVAYRNGKIITMSFENATVESPDGTLLFKPDWGTYDMAVTEKFIGKFDVD